MRPEEHGPVNNKSVRPLVEVETRLEMADDPIVGKRFLSRFAVDGEKAGQRLFAGKLEVVEIVHDEVIMDSMDGYEARLIPGILPNLEPNLRGKQWEVGESRSIFIWGVEGASTATFGVGYHLHPRLDSDREGHDLV